MNPTQYYVVLSLCCVILLLQISMVMRWISFTKQPYLVMNLIQQPQPPTVRPNSGYVYPGEARQLVELELESVTIIHD